MLCNLAVQSVGCSEETEYDIGLSDTGHLSLSTPQSEYRRKKNARGWIEPDPFALL